MALLSPLLSHYLPQLFKLFGRLEAYLVVRLLNKAVTFRLLDRSGHFDSIFVGQLIKTIALPCRGLLLLISTSYLEISLNLDSESLVVRVLAFRLTCARLISSNRLFL